MVAESGQEDGFVLGFIASGIENVAEKHSVQAGSAVDEGQTRPAAAAATGCLENEDGDRVFAGGVDSAKVGRVGAKRRLDHFQDSYGEKSAKFLEQFLKCLCCPQNR